MKRGDGLMVAAAILFFLGSILVFNLVFSHDDGLTASVTGAREIPEKNIYITFIGAVLIFLSILFLSLGIDNELKLFESFRKGRRVGMLKVEEHELTSQDAVSLDELAGILEVADEEMKGDVRKIYGPRLYALRDKAPNLDEPLAKRADDFLKVIEGENYKPYKSRDRQISSYDPRYRGMMKGNPVYVHFTSADHARSIIDGKEGFSHKGPNTSVQALIFESEEKAKRFIDSVTQDKAKEITGTGYAESAIMFQTDILPDKINTVLNGMAKALFDTDIKYNSVKQQSYYPVKKR